MWNINGLLSSKKEVQSHITVNKLDIMLISETHMTHNKVFTLQGFKVYSTNHPDGTAHGGTAVIIKNSIKHHVLADYKTEHIQACSVAVADWQGPLTVTSVYCPPKHNITEEMFTKFFNTLGNRFVADGNWNAKNIC